MELISPKHRVRIISQIAEKLTSEFRDSNELYIYFRGWQQYAKFEIKHPAFPFMTKDVDVYETLSIVDIELLIKIALDLGIDVPGVIPSIPIFRNTIKAEYPTTDATFAKAYKDVETDPDAAIGFANSALESLIKEILKDKRISVEWKETDTLYSLAGSLLDEFKLKPKANMPKEIKTIGSSLLAISSGIEKLRSDKTLFHGKTEGDYIVSDSTYAYLIFNSVCTVGMFIKSFYDEHYPKRGRKKKNIVQ